MPMDFFFTAELNVPVAQMMLLLLITTFALLFNRTKLALLINYLFTLYWGFVFNRHLLAGHEIEYFYVIYLGFGSIVALLASIGFLVHKE
jgi:hypothetical protein